MSIFVVKEINKYKEKFDFPCFFQYWFFFAEIIIAYRENKRENGFNYRTLSVKYKALKYIFTNIDFEIFLPESAVFYIFIASAVSKGTAVFCTITSNRIYILEQKRNFK